MTPEERLSEAIDRLLEGTPDLAQDLPRAQAGLLALARRLLAARPAFWPTDEAAFTAKLLSGYRDRRSPGLRMFSLGAAAVSVVAALALGQLGAGAVQPQALLLGAATPAAQATPNAPRTQSSEKQSVTNGVATPLVISSAPAQGIASAPAQGKHVTTTYSVALPVAQPPARPLQVRALGFGLVALQLPTPQSVRSGVVRATSLTRRTFHLAAVTLRAPEGHGVALLQTNGLPAGWYRVQTSAGTAALFVPAQGAQVLVRRWTAILNPASGGPFAVRFQKTRTEVAFPLGASGPLRLVGPAGAEDPLLSSVRTVWGRPALVLVFDPTPKGAAALHFVGPGGKKANVAVP